jgi:hypothetical protein
VGLKVYGAAGVFATALLCSLLPLYGATSSRFAQFAPHATLFSGGVFLQVALVHMIAESLEALGGTPARNCLVWFFVALGFALARAFPHEHAHSHSHSHHTHQLLDDSLEMETEQEAEAHHTHQRVHRKNLVLVGMLMLHSLSSGLALGLLQDPLSIYNLCLGMMLHKAPEAFSLGVALSLHPSAGNAPSHQRPSIRSNLYLLLLFAAGTPMGMVLGLLLDVAVHSQALGDALSACFVAISGGTFLYLALFETLYEGLFRAFPKSQWAPRVAVFALGYGVMWLASAPHVHHDHIHPHE